MGKYDRYTMFDDPIPYYPPIRPDEPILIYPVRMRQYHTFMQLAPVLLLDMYSIPDPKILSMKYLEYLFHVKKYDEKLKKYVYPYLEALLLLLRSVLKLKDDETIEFFEPDGIVSFRIRGEIFDKNDFEIMREIIIEQNLLIPPNYKITKELRDKMEAARKLKAKMSGNKTASIEDQMVALMTSTGIDLEDIYNFTIRKFSKSLERVDHTLHYKIYLAASVSGLGKFKDKNFIKHWLVSLDKDELGELISYESVETTVTKGNL